MKKYYFLVFIVILFTFFIVKAQTNVTNQIHNLVSEIIIVDKGEIDNFNPIKSINTIAQIAADTVIIIKKSNINAALKKAKDYKYAILTVEDHTIVKLLDFNDEIISGSWGAKMPYGRGYVKRNMQTSFVEDHINYIIGLPDNQTRRLFLFKESKKID